jgi:hypothetical protein
MLEISSNTIEVPRDLIETGDWDAIKKLLPQPEPIFGRWATHPDYGRVLCVSAKTINGRVTVAYESDDKACGASIHSVFTERLTFDPMTLATAEDFDNAPEGTVVTRGNYIAREKSNGNLWYGCTVFTNADMAERGPWTVLRWGRGEQA